MRKIKREDRINLIRRRYESNINDVNKKISATTDAAEIENLKSEIKTL